MDDTIAWLKAQIDEDEGHARLAFGKHNSAKADWTEIWSGTVDTGGSGDEQIACFDAGFSRHIVNSDPARMLREVKAKRRIITEWEEAHRMAEADPTDVSARVARFSFAIAIQALYGVYSDRPGWIEGLTL